MISIKIQTCNICHKWEIIFKILHSPLPPSCNHCYAWFACPPPDSKMDIGLARLMEMSFMREYNPKYNHPATLCFGMKNKKNLCSSHPSPPSLGAVGRHFLEILFHPRSDTNVKQLAFEIFQIRKSGFSEFLNIWRPDHSGT